MRKFGFLDRAVAYLEEAGMEVKVIAGPAFVGPDFY